ncbi:MAG: HlyD family type I secretion periplasmic adaptor subunit [Rhodospirillaceae bacterium]|nr:HlyD family type I secretion periplasmic adaptor subunit [Rhodospirillaceae bacterium]MCA8932457.1 HlyD family type I secretion periplasmic adaptor subunit [Rhodospirillaceae bacterium]
MADLAKPSNDEAERRAEPGPGAAPSPAPLAPAPAAAAVEPLNLVRLMRGPLLFALLAAFVFLGGFGTWAALVPLSSAAIAPGVVSPDGNRRTVQHLEGGIVREILVAEGDRVQVGDPVVVLEDVASRVERDLRESRLNVYRALEARLVAELAGLDELVFPEELVAMAEDDLELATAIEDQRRQFDLRVATLANREEIMRARIAQLRQEIAGRGAQIEALERQSELIDQEITSVETLVRQGLERMPRLLSLERAEAEIAGEIGENQSAIARAEQAIGETDLQIIDLRSNQRQEGAEMLVSVRNEMAEVREELLREEDALDRTIIRAPVAGTVVNLRIFTEGGVIRAGDPILDIVPEDEELIIDARVSPTDIDVVRAGLPAQIHLTAYVQRNLPRLEGEVRTVSADRLTDPQTGESYFQAIVEVPAEALDALGSDVELTPGMPVDVMIATGDHTVLTYLLAPVDRILARTFREQ